mgnify:CR=1 FL=1
MSDKNTFTAQPRSVTGRHVRQLRRQGFTPANVFGKGVASQILQVSTKEFLKLYQKVGESTLIYLHIEGEKDPRPVLINEVLLHPVTRTPLHIVLHQVNLKEKITAPVVVKLVGAAPAEKDKLGILVQQSNQIEIEALPTDMPDHIDVDVSVLVAEGDVIYVKDIQLAAKFLLKSDPDAILAKIEPLAKEEVVVAPVAPVEGEVPAAGEETPPAETTPQAGPKEEPAPAS